MLFDISSLMSCSLKTFSFLEKKTFFSSYILDNPSNIDLGKNLDIKTFKYVLRFK